MFAVSTIPIHRTTAGLFGLSGGANGLNANGSSSGGGTSRDDSFSPSGHISTIVQPIMESQVNPKSPPPASVIKHTHHSHKYSSMDQVNQVNDQVNQNTNYQFEELLKHFTLKHLTFPQITNGYEPQSTQSQINNASSRPTLPARPCQICRIEAAKVSHFGVHVCTGCRAFFRRSITQQKTYTCLNSRLCGNDKLVPNRRVCKFCRYKRCVAAGMLKGRVKARIPVVGDSTTTSLARAKTHTLQLQHSPNILSPREYFASVELAKNVVEQFIVTRRKIAYERMQIYDNEPIELKGLRKNWAIYLKESELLSRNLINTVTPFSEFHLDDQNSITTEFSICWTSLENLWTTVRNGGYDTNRNYYIDGRYFQLNEDGARENWGFVLEDLLRNYHSATALIQMMGNFFLAINFFFNKFSRELAKANLSDDEAAALILLTFTRQEVLSKVSKKSAGELRKLREKVLRNLGAYLTSTGQDVSKRMDQIIALIAPVQEAVCLWKRGENMLKMGLRLANSKHDQLCPDFPKYVELVEKVENYVQNLQIADVIPE